MRSIPKERQGADVRFPDPGQKCLEMPLILVSVSALRSFGFFFALLNAAMNGMMNSEGSSTLLCSEKCELEARKMRGTEKLKFSYLKLILHLILNSSIRSFNHPLNFHI